MTSTQPSYEDLVATAALEIFAFLRDDPAISHPNIRKKDKRERAAAKLKDVSERYEVEERDIVVFLAEGMNPTMSPDAVVSRLGYAA